MKQGRFKSKFGKSLRKLKLICCTLDEAPRWIGREPFDQVVLSTPRRRSPRPLALTMLYAASKPANYRRRRM
ncbi:MAG: hypothetical protein ACK54H_07880 [Phycisphaerales bacterium]